MCVSAATAWEIAVKAQIGKLSLPQSPDLFVQEQMDADSFTPLAINLEHALHVYALPLHHRDPFDRMLVAQCQVEGIPLITVDSMLGRYEIEVIW